MMELNISTNEDISTIEENNYSVSELNNIRESIEVMNKFHQIEILRIFTKYNSVTINENKYGIHINLTDLNKEILDELGDYIKYVNTQETTLDKVEKQKEDFKNIYFTKDNKDNNKLFT